MKLLFADGAAGNADVGVRYWLQVDLGWHTQIMSQNAGGAIADFFTIWRAFHCGGAEKGKIKKNLPRIYTDERGSGKTAKVRTAEGGCAT